MEDSAAGGISIPRAAFVASCALWPWVLVACATGVDPVRAIKVDAGRGSGGAEAATGGTTASGGSLGVGGVVGSGGVGSGGASSSGGSSATGGTAGSTGGAVSSGGSDASGGAVSSGGAAGSPASGGASGSSASGGAQSVGCSDAGAIPLPPGCTPKPPSQCGSAESACTGTSGCRDVLLCVACNACSFANSCSACQSLINQNGGPGGAARSAADNVLSCHGC